MSLLSQLSAIAADAFAGFGLEPAHGEVVVSQRPDLAQFQCNGALPAAKQAGRAPRDIAADVVAAIEADPRADGVIERLSIAGPGFINLDVADTHLAATLETMDGHPRFLVPAPQRASIVVDYGGPNIAKELHVGHLRPAVIGESVKRLLRFLDHEVIGDVHLGDWGLPQGQLITELEREQPGLPYFDRDSTGPFPEESPVTMDDLQQLYPKAAARCAADPAAAEVARRATTELQEGRPGYRALWEHVRAVSIAAMREVFGRLGIEFDRWDGESTVHDRIASMIRRLVDDGYAVRSEGALVVPVDDPDEKREIPPLMLETSHGAYTYGTTDLATIDARVDELGIDGAIYVVDVRQSLHFEQVFRAAHLSGIAGPDVFLEHAGNGTVNRPDGKPFKTREGDLVRLQDLIDDMVTRAAERLDENDLATGYPEEERHHIAHLVGMAALKFGDLQNHRQSNYIFDLERFTSFEGKTGPYLLYGAVRMQSLLRNAADAGYGPGPLIAPDRDAERDLMLTVARFPEVAARAAELRAPNHLAEYAYDVATAFSRFYEQCHVLREEDPVRRGSWIALVELTLRLLTTVLHLLGIDVPERM